MILHSKCLKRFLQHLIINNPTCFLKKIKMDSNIIYFSKLLLGAAYINFKLTEIK